MIFLCFLRAFLFGMQYAVSMVSIVPHSKCDTVVGRVGAELVPAVADFQGSEAAKRFLWPACVRAAGDREETVFTRNWRERFPVAILVEWKSPQ